ncbi:MAG: phenylalanine--tRNA ligase subunit alpha [Firmicutes bacterium]|jgi:phenylalanyl-tRNA synthetase, alpha subunit|nr:phenylalanine--tRNA ligase subunit alpha [Bacillota bacterium]
MRDQLKSILEEATKQLRNASTMEEQEELRVKFLGKKGELTKILRSMGSVGAEERKAIGKLANETREEIERIIAVRKEELKAVQQKARFNAEALDVTEPGRPPKVGVRHPITRTIDEMTRIFMNMGFSLVEGPEIETVFMNFDALNAGPNHPSRDMTDTFYISEDVLLRTQTSPVQARTLLAQKPPIRIISPGRVFRSDTPDATHSPVFHQVEGMVVGENVTMADLKGTLAEFARQMFGRDTKTKFRPHHFPFTEPSAEVDVSCFKCGGKGCRVCKGSGWIEILGCGMVHPDVLKVGKIDTEKYTGYAFGIGAERIAMLKYEVDDIRLFYENDERFLKQFR